MIKCTECSHENEDQRVYCHSCGARLDRSSLLEEAQKPAKVVKPKRRPAGDGSGKFVGNLIKTLLFAGIAACLVQAVRPPDGAPSEKRALGEDIVDAPSISMDLENASSAPARFSYSGAQLNAYLKNKIKAPKNPEIPVWAYAFDSAYANLQKGSIRVSKKCLVLSLPVHVGGTYLPQVTAGVLVLKTLGGNVGRLPIPGVLFDLVDNYIFADFAKSLKEEEKNAGKMQSFQISPKMVVITSGATKK